MSRDGHPLHRRWTAGVARRDITPARGVPLAGYPNPFRSNRGALDDLVLTALCVGDGHEHVVLVSIDVLALHEDVCTEIRERVCDRTPLVPANIVLSAIHSHSSPVASTLPSSPVQQHAHVQQLVERAVSAIIEAFERQHPARLRHGRTTCRTAINRRALDARGAMQIGRDRHAGVDDAVDVIEVIGNDDRRLAVVVNHACHPTIMTLLNLRASAEWPGVMRRAVESRGPGRVLFLQGATADANAPVGPRAGFGYRRVRALGLQVADAVVGALDDTAELEEARVASVARAASVNVIREHGLNHSGPSYVAALRSLIGAPAAAIPGLLDRMYPWRNRQAHEDASVPVELQAVRLGELALAAIGAEPFHQTGLSIKADSPAARTLVAGYSGGMVGYIAPPEQHSLRGYEVALSPYIYRFSGIFDVDAEPTIRREVGHMLAELFPDG